VNNDCSVDWVALVAVTIEPLLGALLTYLAMRHDWKVGRSLRPPRKRWWHRGGREK